MTLDSDISAQKELISEGRWASEAVSGKTGQNLLIAQALRS
ncbi:MAG: hypothetical protein DHS20C17_35200 [Cyclobacteriaceae bacterium]|nr:MAG: hypothetical protein DHS20C17_35200 [Cyclobacteriaceae bacterium]